MGFASTAVCAAQSPTFATSTRAYGASERHATDLLRKELEAARGQRYTIKGV
jgi:hypothetical protein